MSKKTISANLEEDTIEIIDNLQKDKKLKSRSAAIDRIVLEWNTQKETIRKTIRELLNEKDNDITLATSENTIDEEEVIDEFEKASLEEINNSLNDMPD